MDDADELVSERSVLIVGEQQQFNYDGDRTDEQPHAFYSMEFPNYWNLRTFWIHNPTLDDDRLTRGGPVVKRTGYNFEHFRGLHRRAQTCGVRL